MIASHSECARHQASSSVWLLMLTLLWASDGVIKAPGHQKLWAASDDFQLTMRRRIVNSDDSARERVLFETRRWHASETAWIVCDMWDQHWCPQASSRVAEMAPRMNLLLHEVRKRGGLIIHCPSGTMDFYQQHPARLRATQIPAYSPPMALQKWCPRDPEREPPLPIDDSDGGCDCPQPLTPQRVWTQQIATLEIDPERDLITDSEEIYSILQHHHIRHVAVMGVHTNMCVLGRPFSIRQLVRLGYDVALVRDLTDSMYNPSRAPYVNHFTGTDLVIEHIERYWCPTFTSGDVVDGKEFRFSQDQRPHVVIVSAEDEYRTERTLPEFARRYLGHTFRTTILLGAARKEEGIPGLESLDHADVLLLSVRRRPLPPYQMALIRRYQRQGKPIVGIRTASHPFHLRQQEPPLGLVDWPEWDPQILGGHYTNHYPNHIQAYVRALEGVRHPILEGIPTTEWPTSASLYRVSPLEPGAVELMRGRCEGVEQEEPVAWTFIRQDGGRSFYTSLGHPDDFHAPAFCRLLYQGLCWAAGITAHRAALEQNAPSSVQNRNTENSLNSDKEAAHHVTGPREQKPWIKITVPGTWDQLPTDIKGYTGIGWYRCQVKIPSSWRNQTLYLFAGHIAEASEAYVNGIKVGVSGEFPPGFKSGRDQEHRYVMPTGIVHFDRPNTISFRVYSPHGQGGFVDMAPAVLGGGEAIILSGSWEFTATDAMNERFSSSETTPAYEHITEAPRLSPYATIIQRRVQEHPLTPGESLRHMKIPDDLIIECVLSEPVITQPLFISFDERSRLWVLNYKQYPEPAGLKLVSKDKWWRAVYDRVPPPPPYGPKGADCITVHEDVDGDGSFDLHRTFLDGLNIATSFARGRGGVYVLNPPYLLFYPDRNDDLVPDGDPETLLAGFGLEDTHSVVNSLRWGPDGWLYAAQGSTVSAQVSTPGTTQTAFSQGQNIWRYHPETKRYEIFAEGGGNAFSCEIDQVGRIYSGYNGGNAHGFHYVQGGYFIKGFNKHGALSNPYAYGYFSAMQHGSYGRFTHNFIIYEGDGLPSAYRGRLMGVNPLLNHVIMAEMMPEGSTFRTQSAGMLVESSDAWFRPVDIKDGPDGCVYIADWYDGQLAHTANYQGGLDRTHGRVYRLRSRTSVIRQRTVPQDRTSPGACERNPNLADWASPALIDLLRHPNRWHRQTALRLLADRQRDVLQHFWTMRPINQTDEVSLDEFWARWITGGLRRDDARWLHHSNFAVRSWFVRLHGDDREIPPHIFPAVLELARTEQHPEVVSQLAATSARLAPAQGLPLLETLLRRSEFVNDARIPLQLWWGLEAQISRDVEASLHLFDHADLWREPLVQTAILSRLMRRLSASGQKRGYSRCVQLLRLAPDHSTREIMLEGLQESLQGRSLRHLPEDLAEAIVKSGKDSLAFRIRRSDSRAVEQGLSTLEMFQPGTESTIINVATALAEIRESRAIPKILFLLENSADESLKQALIPLLGSYKDEEVARRLIKLLPQFTEDTRNVALGVLATRLSWAQLLMNAIEQQLVAVSHIPTEVVRQLVLLGDEALTELVRQRWPDIIQPLNTQEIQQEIHHISEILLREQGNPYIGKKIYMSLCGKCHKLHGTGGDIGPDLTPYKRHDVRAMLVSILEPSAEIREGFENYAVTTTDGRVISGFLVEQQPEILTLRTALGETITLDRVDVEDFQRLPVSLMPAGQLKSLTEEEIRHLFAYLRSSQPLDD
ncbi:MAG: hypothetical protein KatS3mg113_0770 [Planctomycetaceae bacterium]|nr:MAG: hypothetical protein KatS3mg113_0770 [Planctomycetaceae bacterium]